VSFLCSLAPAATALLLLLRCRLVAAVMFSREGALRANTDRLIASEAERAERPAGP